MTITVRNRLTAFEAAKACVDAGVSLAQGIARNIFCCDPAWGWTPSDVYAVAQDNGLPVAYWA